MEGKVEGKWWEVEKAPDCWCWPASVFWTLWLSQRWWRRKPTKEQEWKAVKSRKARAPQRWWWQVTICGPRGYSLGMTILIHTQAQKAALVKAMTGWSCNANGSLLRFRPWTPNKEGKVLLSVYQFFFLKITSFFILRTNGSWQF